MKYGIISLIDRCSHPHRCISFQVSTRDSSSMVDLAIFLLNDRDEAEELCSSMDVFFRAGYMANKLNSDIRKQFSSLTQSIPSARQLRSSFDSTTSSTPSTIRSLSLASASSACAITPNEPTIIEDDSVKPRRRHRYVVHSPRRLEA